MAGIGFGYCKHPLNALTGNTMTLNKLIQIAGVIDQEEAELLLASGVQWLGFPLRLPVNLPDLTEARRLG